MASSDLQAKKSRKRSDYGYRQVHQTRWYSLEVQYIHYLHSFWDDIHINEAMWHRFDNDMYAHLNNTVYTALFDTIANAYLIEHCGRNPFSVNNPSTKNPSPKSNFPGKPSSQKQEPEASTLDAGDDQIGLIVSTHCDFFASVAFPDRLEVGLRVAKLGSSSVTWEIGVFREGEEDVKMVGTYTHVFVLRETMRVGKGGMVRQVRDGLEKLLNEPGAKL